MNFIKKRLLFSSILLIFFLNFSSAENTTINGIEYTDITNVDFSSDSTLQAGNYIVNSNVNISDTRVLVGSEVTIYLEENCTLIIPHGINLIEAGILTIDGKGTIICGHDANGNDPRSNGQAGIGGNAYQPSGTFIVNGGNVYAYGSNNGYAAAIGTASAGGGASVGGPVIINGGYVYAYGVNGAAAIGGCAHGWIGRWYGTLDRVTVNGGVLEIEKDGNGYAIGPGPYSGWYNSVTINGGKVKVTLTGSDGKGIGYNKADGDAVLTLGWTNPDDYIDIPSYGYRALVLKDDKPLRFAGAVKYGEETKVKDRMPASTTEGDVESPGAVFVPWIEHTVTFVDNDFYLTENKALYNGLVTEPEVPVKNGYTFNGWYKDKALTTSFDFNSTEDDYLVKGDMTLYAKYTIDPSAANQPQISVSTETYYIYTGNPIAITPLVTTENGTRDLISGSDYTYSIKDSTGAEVTEVVNAGTYTLTVTGCNSYAGLTCSTTFYVEKDSSNSSTDPDPDPHTDPDPHPGSSPLDQTETGSLTQDAEDLGLYITMPADGKIRTLDLTDKTKGFSFKIYDDGGKGGSYFSGVSGNYSPNAVGYLLVTVPENYLIQLSGTVGTKSKYDYLTVYDGPTAQAPVLCSKVYGQNSETTYLTELESVNSSSNQILLYFKGSSLNCEGLDLTASIVDKRVLSAQSDLFTDGAYYTTFYTEEENYIADSDTTVFYATTKEDGKLLLKEVTDRIIKKNQGVVLKSANSQINLYATNQTSDYTSALKGCTSDSTMQNIYILGTNERGGVGFYKYSGSVKAGKAWLEGVE